MNCTRNFDIKDLIPKGDFAGALKPGFEKEKSKFDKVNNGSEVIEKYREKSSVKNYLEFDDMILWTRKLL